MSQILKAYLDAVKTRRPSFDITKAAFDKQLAFINDQAKLKALFCTRRAAKSYTGGLYLIETALKYPGSNCLFIGLTRQTAHGIIWKDILRELDTKYKLGIKFNETLLTATFPNGSVIWVTGADTDEQEMNKLLGKKYKLVVIDESSMFTVNMHQLVYGVLKPATADQRGTICLLGTASNITRGLFFDITTGKEAGWSLHQWSAFDNPHISRQWAEELQEIEEKRPKFKQTALFRQWYLNEWVIDEDALVYKFNKQRNISDHLPAASSPYHYVLGIDLGHSPDPTGFVIGAYSDDANRLYFIHAEKHLRFDITDVANRIAQLEKIWKFDVKVVDNANKQAVAELNNRHGANLIPADKTGKADFINLMNDDFIQAKIMVASKCQELVDEYQSLVWETDGDKIKEPRKEHPSIPNHLTDAALYTWRYCYQYLWTKALPFVDYRKQEVWEPKHMEKLSEQIQIEKNPNHWSKQFQPDEGLFDFEQDDQI